MTENWGMKNVLIFDDEPMAARAIQQNIEKYPRANELSISCAHNPSELRTYLDDHGYPDIFFSDIMIGQGLSGIDLAQKLFPSNCGTQVVFISGMLENALEVYRADHVYFLTKPIQQGKLNDALDKCLSNLANSKLRLYEVKSKSTPMIIRVSAINYVESNARKVKIHTNERVLEEYNKLDDVQKTLPDTFIRIHKSYLVNASVISRASQDEVELNDGTILPISKSHLRSMRESLLRFAKDRM